MARPKQKKGKPPTVREQVNFEECWKKFCHEYVKHWNGTRAAIAVGCPSAGATTTACRWLARAIVREYIEQLKAKMISHTDATTERIIREASRIAFFDPRSLYRADGTPIPIVDLDDDTAAAVAGLDIKELRDANGNLKGYDKRYKIAPKDRALDLLARYRKLLTDKSEHSFLGADGKPVDPPSYTVQFVDAKKEEPS